MSSILVLVLLQGCGTCPGDPAVLAVEPTVTSTFLDGARLHGPDEDPVAWLELEGTCIAGGEVGEVGQPAFALGEAPADQGRWGTWYVWTGEPLGVRVASRAGAGRCFGAGDGCEPLPPATLAEPIGPWIGAEEWWETEGHDAFE